MNYKKDSALQQNIKPEISYFDKIDVIRFVAAMMVVIYHAYAGWVSNWHYLKFMTNEGGGAKFKLYRQAFKHFFHERRIRSRCFLFNKWIFNYLFVA